MKFNCMYDFDDFLNVTKRHENIVIEIKEGAVVTEVMLSHADAKALAERLTDICRGAEQ